MKKFAIVLVALLAMSGMATAQENSQESTVEQDETSYNIQDEFFGCKLGKSDMEEVKSTLQAHKLTVAESEDSYVAMDVTLNGFKFSAALFQFNELGVLNSVTFLNSGLSRSEALDFGQAIYTALNSKYIMIKRVIDGLDCYFSSSNDITCQLSTQASDETYFVRLDYQVGTAILK